MNRGAFIAFALGVFFSLPACAGAVATVQTITGTLSLNRGDGFVEVISFAEAPAGSQVMANPGSQGKIVYYDGCEFTVSPGTVYTVQDGSPCQSGVRRGPARNYVIGGLVVAGAAVAVVALTAAGDSGGPNHKPKRKKDHSASP
jgi:hypothetical protein